MPWVIDLDRLITMTLRKPTPIDQLYAWHRKALAMPDPDRGIPNSPCCGWFKRRLVKGGPWVPAQIWCFQLVDDAGDLIDDESLQCEVNGFWADPYDQWSYVCGNPISEAEWQYMEATRRWAEAHAPDDPANRPGQKIDLMTAPLPFRGRKP